MTLHPAVLALLASSLTVSAMVLYAGWYGMAVRAKWDINSGSEVQVGLERRTYLVSTILGYALVFQLLSLFLFIYTADDLHKLFTGAMCAAGTLNVNGFGYPVLILKVVNFILAGVWLIINHVDTRGYDYPLIRVKYALLGLLAPLVLLETLLMFGFFSGLRPDVITSCCGSLFSSDRPGIAGDLASLPYTIVRPVFFASIAATTVSGLLFYLKGRGAYLFSAVSGTTFLVASASLVSFICLYYYELPTHHCPFCILQGEYGHAGYALYASLLAGAVSGAGVGALAPFRDRASLKAVISGVQRRLAVVAVVMYLLFTALVSYRMLVSSFRLGGD